MTTPTTTPLTDAELNWLTEHLPDAFDRNIGAGAAAEIRALRTAVEMNRSIIADKLAELRKADRDRDDLLAALKGCAEFWTNDTPVYPGSEAAHDVLAAIARAEGDK